uniref:Uncharacterized protein n=1 Tax=Melopsittacus undulatus TaxID=13146 RepID=A0A8V5HGC7_MELUD
MHDADSALEASFSPHPWFPAGVHTSALLQFPFCTSNLKGFILVHLNIHDSLHCCSKRHLFI